MDLSDHLDSIPEHLKCPICMELPKAKVLQCREGHTLCEKCYSQLKTCPQCRLPFGKEPIRNRAVEKMLDDLSHECPYKSSGCAKKLDRKRFENHVKLCYFNFAKFGPFVNGCENIGIKNCTFQMNRGNVAEAIQHLKTAHKIAFHGRNINNRFIFRNFTSRVFRQLTIGLNRKEGGYGFVVTLKPEAFGGNNHLVWNAFYWRYPSPNGDAGQAVGPLPYSVELSLSLPGEAENTLKWTVSPSDILKPVDPTSVRRSMKMPGYLFADRTTGTLSGSIKIVPSSASA